MEVPFVKMHGLGNDFIFIAHPHHLRILSASSPTPEDHSTRFGQVARVLCRRRFGVGADGLALLLPASLPRHHFRFELYNADGSAAAMCGNALRCAAKLAWERRRQLLSASVDEPVLVVDTPAGEMVAHLTLSECGERVAGVRVNMGRPLFARGLVPCLLRADGGSEDAPVLMAEYALAGRAFRYSSVLVGVPHTIIFVERADDEELIGSLGPAMEKDHTLFPQGTNVGFVQVLPDNHINYRVWERGVGPTLACGTGASAAAVVAAVLGHVDGERPVRAHLAGGDLTLRVDMSPPLGGVQADSPTGRAARVERVWMEGPAEIVCEGVANITL